MDILVTYDISESSLKKDVKKEMNSLGYMSFWTDGSTDEQFHLPESTVWKKNIELREATADLRSAIERVKQDKNSPNLKLVRYVAVPSSPWTAIKGSPTDE